MEKYWAQDELRNKNARRVLFLCLEKNREVLFVCECERYIKIACHNYFKKLFSCPILIW